jgi:hypothetical protein
MHLMVTKPEAREVSCRRCGHVMRDSAPRSPSGEFVHARRVCSNSERRFSLVDATEIMLTEATRPRRRIR